MQEITEILQTVRGDIDFTNATNLVSDGIITSFDILQIVMELEEKFDIEKYNGGMKFRNGDTLLARIHGRL